jgi:uncharacterized repeat protein (TIGR01451 family)
LYQNICLVTGETFNFSIAHRGRLGADRAQLQVGPNPAVAGAVILDVTTSTGGTGTINAGGGATATSATAIAGGWTRYAGSYTFTGASGVQALGFTAISTSSGNLSVGNFLDDFNIVFKPYVEFTSTATTSVEGGAAVAPVIKVVGIVPAGGLVLNLGISGSATLGSDFNFTGTTTLGNVTATSTTLSVTVPAGTYTDALANNLFTLPLNIINDTVIENNETVLLSMPPNGTSSLFINANSTVCGGTVTTVFSHTIIDNDIDLQTTKSVNTSGTVTLGSTLTYTLTYANVTPPILSLAPLTAHDATNVLITDAAPPGVNFGAWTCSAVGTTCPAATGSGSISQTVALPVGSTLTYVVQAGFTSPALCESTVVNTSTIANTATSPSGANLTEGTSVQGNAGYALAPNSATVSNVVQPCASLSITKSNGVSTVTAGDTTTYTIVVNNAGPSAAHNALLQDPVATGLSCTAVSCVASSGSASCPVAGDVTMPLLQSSGIVLTNFPANSSLTFQVTCDVTATGV